MTTVAIPATKQQPAAGGFYVEFVCGCVAGFFKVYLGQPFDIIKVRLQRGAAQGASAMDLVRNLYKESGVTGFWKGSLPPLLGIGATVSLQFGVNENSKKLLAAYKGNSKFSPLELFTCGALGGFANCIVSIPVEHLRIRMQTQNAENPIYKGSLDCGKQIFSQNGWKGLFKGTQATIIRDSVGYGSYFAMFAMLSNWVLKPGQTKRDMSYLDIFWTGAVAGIVFWNMVFPMDVIKTKFQTDSFTSPKYTSLLQAAKDIHATRGLNGFYPGYWPCMLRAIPVNGGVFCAFEWLYREMIGYKKH